MSCRPERRRRRPLGGGSGDGPRTLASSLDEVVAGLRPPPDPGTGAPGSADATTVVTGAAKALGSVFARWDEIAGPALSRHVRPLELSAETLTVAVDHPAWATQVRLLAAEVLGRVGDVTGARPARLELRVRQSARR